MAQIIAHRGGSLEAPENTCAAIAHAVAAGADFQEVDVTLSADGQVVVVHDATLARTAACAIDVELAAAAQLQACDVGRPAASAEQLAERAVWSVPTPPWPAAAPRCAVPTLAQALAVPGARLMIELKDGPQGQRLVAQVAQVLAAAGRLPAAGAAPPQPSCLVGSFSPQLLALAAVLMPTVPQVGIAADLAQVRPWLQRRPWALAVHTAAAAQVRALWGLRLWAWTVCCAPQAAELVAAGVDGLITDVPAQLVRLGMRGPLAAQERAFEPQPTSPPAPTIAATTARRRI